MIFLLLFFIDLFSSLFINKKTKIEQIIDISKSSEEQNISLSKLYSDKGNILILLRIQKKNKNSEPEN